MSAAKKNDAKQVRVTLVRSTIGRQGVQRRITLALGLKKLHQTKVHYDTPTVRGMINKIPHLLKVEDA